MLNDNETYRVDCGDCLPWLQMLADRACSLVVTSPPYEHARTYGVGCKRRGQDWVDWMAPIVVECCRVTDGLVCVNMAATVRDFRYSPAVEWLVADLTRNCWIVCGPSPYCYFRRGTPGSGSDHYHKRDWEPVYCFALPDRLPLKWSDNTATGHTPKWAPGGEMSNRLTSGQRCNQWGARSTGTERKQDGTRGPKRKPSHRMHTKRGLDGEMMDQGYVVPVKANSGNVIQETYTAEQVAAILLECGVDDSDVRKCLVGGGLMGSPLAHKSEAPMSQALAEFFVRSFAPPGSIVMDPFTGSGTTLDAALKWDRRAIGCELRESQCDIARQRCAAAVTLFRDMAA